MTSVMSHVIRFTILIAFNFRKRSGGRVVDLEVEDGRRG
jgi:hypothetical protein